MIRSGKFISQFIKTDSESIQPNGVDLSIDKIYGMKGYASLSNDGYSKPSRSEIELEDYEVENIDGKSYKLYKDYYIVEYNEVIEIPEDHIGLVLPRSRLMRCGGTLYTAVWDSGYKGKGEGGLNVRNLMYLEENMNIGQIIYIETEKLSEHYDGSHQEENI